MGNPKPNKKSQRVSIRAFGRAVGLSPAGAQKAIDSGRVKRGRDGKLNLAQAKKALKQNTDPGKQRNGDPPTSFLQARAIFEYYRAQREKLEYEREAGKLISAELVESQAFALFRVVRDSMLNVPQRVAAVIAGNPQKTQEWIYQLLRQEITSACKVLGDPNGPEDEKLTSPFMKRSENDPPLKR